MSIVLQALELLFLCPSDISSSYCSSKLLIERAHFTLLQFSFLVLFFYILDFFHFFCILNFFSSRKQKFNTWVVYMDLWIHCTIIIGNTFQRREFWLKKSTQKNLFFFIFMHAVHLKSIPLIQCCIVGIQFIHLFSNAVEYFGHCESIICTKSWMGAAINSVFHQK